MTYFLQFGDDGAKGHLGLLKQTAGGSPVTVETWDGNRIFKYRGSNPSNFNLDTLRTYSGWYWINKSAVGGTWPTQTTLNYAILVEFYLNDLGFNTQIFINPNAFIYRMYLNSAWKSWKVIS